MTSSTKPVLARRKAPREAGPIPDPLLQRLTECLAARRIAEGIRLLEQNAHLLQGLAPERRNAGCLVAALAEWVDVGLDHPTRLRASIARFPTEDRGRLLLRDYLGLRLAEGMLAMMEELADVAIAHLDFVIGLAEELRDRETLSIANFCKARCLRKKGEYDQALGFATRGRDLAVELGHPATAALMRVLESWLLFQKGKTRQATTILQQAHAVLRHTDDHVTLGNIHSAYGRIARRDGRYEQAIEHFTRACEEYKKQDPQHRNLARSLANMALVKRFIALQLRKKIDAGVQRRRTAQGKAGGDGSSRKYRERMEELRRQAFADLEEAAAIYPHHPNHHGAGTVHLNRGYLCLDSGDFDEAEENAQAAHALGEQKRDLILMARARLLQCMVENGRVEQGIGEHADPGRHAQRALECAREALELARHTENRRLLASAYVWQGLSECNSFFDDFDAARHSYEQALALLKRDEPGSVGEDMNTLKAKVFRSGSIDATLRAWSQGSAGGKTFQQLTEEFAEIVIPKVWEREGRKVSRVAARLSISPKKVRRILSRAGKRKGS